MPNGRPDFDAMLAGSNKRTMPGGPVDKDDLQKGPEGRALCRWCSLEVPARRRTFCSEWCVSEWRLRSDPGYLREKTFERDRGVCALCATDTAAEWLQLKRSRGSARARLLSKWGLKTLNRRSLWDADHIVPVAEGGGECDLQNIRTLCLTCHRDVTKKLRDRLKRPLLALVLLCLAAGTSAAQSAQSYIDEFWRRAPAAAKPAWASHAPKSEVRESNIPGIQKSGAIHHIEGHVFVPGARLDAIVERVRDYNSHADLFAPVVKAAALCGKEGSDVFIFRYWMTPYRDSISETRAVHRRVDGRTYTVSSKTSAFGNPGDLADSNNLCNGILPGVSYLKQLNAVWRYEQMKDGVDIGAESVAELSGFALVRATARRVLVQILRQSLDQYLRRFRKP
jgi:5-methylcytosine-specific restriction enzyme A